MSLLAGKAEDANSGQRPQDWVKPRLCFQAGEWSWQQALFLLCPQGCQAVFLLSLIPLLERLWAGRGSDGHEARAPLRTQQGRL